MGVVLEEERELVVLSRHVLFKISCSYSSSAKESVPSAKTSSSERKETKQEKKSHQSPQKDSESFEKQVAEQSCENSARGVRESAEADRWVSKT